MPLVGESGGIDRRHLIGADADVATISLSLSLAVAVAVSVDAFVCDVSMLMIQCIF